MVLFKKTKNRLVINMGMMIAALAVLITITHYAQATGLGTNTKKSHKEGVFLEMEISENGIVIGKPYIGMPLDETGLILQKQDNGTVKYFRIHVQKYWSAPDTVTIAIEFGNYNGNYESYLDSHEKAPQDNLFVKSGKAKMVSSYGQTAEVAMVSTKKNETVNLKVKAFKQHSKKSVAQQTQFPFPQSYSYPWSDTDEMSGRNYIPSWLDGMSYISM